MRPFLWVESKTHDAGGGRKGHFVCALRQQLDTPVPGMQAPWAVFPPMMFDNNHGALIAENRTTIIIPKPLADVSVRFVKACPAAAGYAGAN